MKLADGTRQKILDKEHFGATVSPRGNDILYFDEDRTEPFDSAQGRPAPANQEPEEETGPRRQTEEPVIEHGVPYLDKGKRDVSVFYKKSTDQR